MVLGALVNHPERLNRETLYELRAIVARYPYFQTARLLMLNNMYLLHEPDFGMELRRSVLYVADRRALCRLIEGESKVELDETLLAEEPSVDRTMSLIDAFLGTLPGDVLAPDPLTESVAGGDYVMQYLTDAGGADEDASIPDILTQLLSSADKDENSLSDAAEKLAVGVTQNTAADTDIAEDSETALLVEESLDESYFTETLAKIYIKQKKYSRALEIIRSLYLQFPEKNAYFADQIRFLEKLIINNNLK